MSIFFKIAITAAIIVLGFIFWLLVDSPYEDVNPREKVIVAMVMVFYGIFTVSFLTGIWLL